MKAHGIRRVLDLLIVTNQCPFCRTVFSSRQAVARHARGAVETGMCKAGLSTSLTTIIPPSHLGCPLCEEQCPDLSALQEHVCQHLPERPRHVVRCARMDAGQRQEEGARGRGGGGCAPREAA
eukprot:9417150-Lingulodinium_polyedra.AAC.1